MPTSRKYPVFTHPSQILTSLFYGTVTNQSKTRIVFQTGLYDDRESAEFAAHEWARFSHSLKAKSLGPKA
jgi:hypothetical protein